MLSQLRLDVELTVQHGSGDGTHYGGRMPIVSESAEFVMLWSASRFPIKDAEAVVVGRCLAEAYQF